ncbi:unnamed protein product [Blepharisma stoltei]|uniref:C2 NT-type domain-containing protein n=1 Tax=Blepharisma stoltei TaxID=1481888 RepID=A0AAU9JVL0_9CILI|nr:unnamed protein product [Blepharisma stoltei]
MSIIQRIGASTESYLLELTIHSVTINIPYPVKLKVIVKRGKNYKEETSAVNHDLVLGTIFFEHTVLLRVTMFRKSRSYLKKNASFRLVQISKNKCIKNGKGRLDLSKIFTHSPSFEKQDIKLKHCSDKNAYICISATMTRIDRTSSMGSISAESISSEEADMTDLIPVTFAYSVNSSEMSAPEVKNEKLSLTMNSEESSKKKKQDAREKFKKRLEKLTIAQKSHTVVEPNTAYPYQEMESPSPSPTISPQPKRTEWSFSNDPKEFELSPNELNGLKDIPIIEKEKPEPKPFFLKPIKIGCDDDEISNSTNNNKEEQEVESVKNTENEQCLPATSLKGAIPNSNSKENEIKARECVGGLSSTNSACSSCKGCVII